MIVAFTGLIGSGKDTAASIFIKHGFKHLTFAGPIKQIAKIFGFTEKEIYGTQKEKLAINKEWGISGRYFMQKFGTEICRDYLPTAIPEMNMNGQTIWIRLVDIYLKQHLNENVVITDLRFLDEAKIIKEYGGTIIKIIRPSCISKGDTLEKGVSKGDTFLESVHASEIDISKIEGDYTIFNDGTLEEFQKKVIDIKMIFKNDAIFKNYVQRY